MEKLLLHSISFEDNGHKITYQYETMGGVQKFFNKEQAFYSKYGIDVRSTPQSIAVIPFLSNILPISWYAGFTIEIDEVDEDFFNAQELIKNEFSKRDISKPGGGGGLVARKLVKNSFTGDKTAMLFSGGVDAYATYIRIFDKNPDLVTLLGADIEIKDQKQWKDFTDFIESEDLLRKNRKEYVETNLRDFYTYQVELLQETIGWWGKVQHGLALVGALAPLSYVHAYGSIYIASSYTDHIDIDWGSTPEIDEKITWGGGLRVYHDGYDLKRQEKVDLIAKFATEKKKNFKLRVCYSEKRTEFNCSYCEKCFRTILGLILNGEDPNNYGFQVDASVYDKIYEIHGIGGASKGVRYFWWELMEKAKNISEFYVFENLDKEKEQINRIRGGAIDQLLEHKINNPTTGSDRFKFIVRNKFPWLYKLYRSLRSN